MSVKARSRCELDPVPAGGNSIYSAMRRSCLPALRPSNSRRSVLGAFSRPCCTSTLFLIFPDCTQPASAPIASRGAGQVIEHEEAFHSPALDHQVEVILGSRRGLASRCNSRSHRKAPPALASRAAPALHRGLGRRHCRRRCRCPWDRVPSAAPERSPTYSRSRRQSRPHRSASGISPVRPRGRQRGNL